jgi:hypothetical protein
MLRIMPNRCLKSNIPTVFSLRGCRLIDLSQWMHLNDSPETSLSVTFLLKLHELTGRQEYKEAALKAMGAVIRDVIPYGRWEDFETYWSCSRYGSQDLVGEKNTPKQYA